MAFSVASAPPLVKKTMSRSPGASSADQPGGLAAGVVGVDRGDRAELVGLLLDRRDQLGVLVADVDVDELAGEVEVAVALVVPEPRALGADDDERVERGLRRPGVEDVGPVVEVGLRAVACRGGRSWAQVIRYRAERTECDCH